MSHITINDLIEYEGRRLGLALLAGEAGINRKIQYPTILIHNPHDKAISEETEQEAILLVPLENLKYLNGSSLSQREDFLNHISKLKVLLIILSGSKDAPDFLVNLSEEKGIPLLSAVHDPSFIKSGLAGIFRKEIDRKVDVHGVLMDIFGIGVMIKGESGIGKSECGLELITRGHKLIADDLVEIKKTKAHTLRGRSKKLTRYFMEIRGLGIVNIKSLFGIAAVGDEIDVNIVVELIKWENGVEFSRIDSEETPCVIMGSALPLIRVPVRSGGTMATVVEIVARNFILKMKDPGASEEIEKIIIDKIRKERGH